MALLGAYSVPNSAAVKLSTLIPGRVKKIDIRANPDNAAVVYLGASGVTIAGVNAWIALSAGEAWGVDYEGDEIQLEPENIWLIATTTDKVHISYVT
jgi:hypothetical protein